AAALRSDDVGDIDTVLAEQVLLQGNDPRNAEHHLAEVGNVDFLGHGARTFGHRRATDREETSHRCLSTIVVVRQPAANGCQSVPHTARAVCMILSNFRHCSSSPSCTPPTPLLKPHCGLSASWSSGRWRAALSMRRLRSSGDSRVALLVVTSPSTAIVSLRTKRSGSKLPARSLSYSSSKRWCLRPENNRSAMAS